MNLLKFVVNPLSALVVLIVMLFVLVALNIGSLGIPTAQDTEPLVPSVEPAYVVKVANRQGNTTFKGYGVAVDYKGVKFILTSRVLFVTPDDSMNVGKVTVNGDLANTFAVNLESDLVALYVYTSEQDYLELPLKEKEQPNSAVITTTDRQSLAEVVDADLRDEWIAVDHAPIGSEGAPLFQDGDLVGLMLGFSKKGTAIVATNKAIFKFGRQIRREQSREGWKKWDEQQVRGAK